MDRDGVLLLLVLVVGAGLAWWLLGPGSGSKAPPVTDRTTGTPCSAAQKIPGGSVIQGAANKTTMGTACAIENFLGGNKYITGATSKIGGYVQAGLEKILPSSVNKSGILASGDPDWKCSPHCADQTPEAQAQNKELVDNAARKLAGSFGWKF